MKLKILLILLLSIVISVILGIVFWDDLESPEYTERNKSITLNKQSYYETDEAKESFQNSLGSLDIWEDFLPNQNTNKPNNNYNIVFGELSTGEIAYLKDIQKLYKQVSEDLSKDPDIKFGAPPMWFYLGIANSETSQTVNIGGIKFPSFLLKYKGDNIKEYKEGELFTGTGINTNYNTSHSYKGVFQMTVDALKQGVKRYNPNININSLSAQSPELYLVKNQWYSLGKFHSGTNGKYSLTKDYDELDGIKSEWLWAFATMSHIHSSALSFPKGMAKYWVPFIQEIFSPRYVDALLNIDIQSKTLSDRRSYFTGLGMYAGVKSASKTGSKFFAGSSKSSDKLLVQFDSRFSVKTWYNLDKISTLLPDFKTVVGTWEQVSSDKLKSNQFIFRNYTARDMNQAYMASSTYRSNGSSTIFMENPKGEYAMVISLAGIQHLAYPYLIGSYLETAVNIGLSKSTNSSSSPIPNRWQIPSSKLQSYVQPSLYYNEYDKIRSGEVKNIGNQLAMNSYERINTDTIDNLLNNSYEDNKHTIGSFGEIGWKGVYPIFSQPDTSFSKVASLTFNNKRTTLADAGCSIYSLVSMLYGIGLGSTPVPNTKSLSNNGLNSNGFIDPIKLSKIVTAPIIPEKLEKLGYTVETHSMKTREDIIDLFNTIKRTKNAYMVNTRKSSPIKALIFDGKEIERQFTNSGHFILITNVFEINGKTYFEVVDSITSSNPIDSNRLYYDLEDAIDKDALGRSSRGGVVPAFRITGINNSNISSTTKFESILENIERNELGIKISLPDSTLVQVSSDSIRIFIDNINYIYIPINETEHNNKTGIYSRYDVITLPIFTLENIKVGQYQRNKYTEYDYSNINNFIVKGEPLNEQ